MKHHCKYVSKRLALLLLVLFVGTFTLTGCGSGGGSDDYDTTKSASNETLTELANTPVIITPQILKGWMDQGLVNKDDSFDGRVVILSVETTTETEEDGVVTEAYPSSHIPGSQPWGSLSAMTREEGLSEVSNMVLDGPSIDSILARTGVDENTTIVLTSADGGAMTIARAYFTLRYWGFPKDKIKVLNGGDSAWEDAGAEYELTEAAATPASTSMSVSDNEEIATDVRISMAEMILAAEENAETPAYNIIDARGGDDHATSHILYALDLGHMLFYDETTFKNKAEIETALGADFDPSLPSISYCVSGWRASVPFFVLDAIMGYDVALYDGSWNQWKLYTDPYKIADDDETTEDKDEEAFGNLNDLWVVDEASDDDLTFGTLTPTVGDIDADLNATLNDLEAPEANQIETEDTEYIEEEDAEKAGPGEGDNTLC